MLGGIDALGAKGLGVGVNMANPYPWDPRRGRILNKCNKYMLWLLIRRTLAKPSGHLLMRLTLENTLAAGSSRGDKAETEALEVIESAASTYLRLYSSFGRITIKYKHSQTRTTIKHTQNINMHAH